MTNYHNSYNLHVDKCRLFPRRSLVNRMVCCWLLNRKRPDEASEYFSAHTSDYSRVRYSYSGIPDRLTG